ncbi:hypothetical protein [Marinobacter sp. P4B1]|uniref:hypothetical protein n=1 Tax=Marinobacter sp. P4B1 TaxID=1119533 RepID=UPI0011A1F64B|nr:hypothetical protein [Marinobacter sp. P4B1]
MKTLHLRNIALIATMATALGVSHAAIANSKESVELPVKGGIFLHKLEDGQTVLMSGDGRFVIPGRFVDREQGMEVIASIDKAKELYSEGASVTGTNRLEQVASLIDRVVSTDMLKYQVGEQDGNKEEVVVFIDPLCPYCHQILKMQPELTDEYVFVNVVIPLLGPRSDNYVSQLSCVEPDTLGEVILSRNMSPDVTDACRDEEEAVARRTANTVGIESVPYTLSKKGGVQLGAFRTVEQFKAFLEGRG